MSSGNKETAISLLSLEIIKSETKILRYHRATYSMHIPKHNGGVIGGGQHWIYSEAYPTFVY
jgi:hypothetical protein